MKHCKSRVIIELEYSATADTEGFALYDLAETEAQCLLEAGMRAWADFNKGRTEAEGLKTPATAKVLAILTVAVEDPLHV